MNIRALEIGDIDEFIALCREHAIYEGGVFKNAGKPKRLEKLISDEVNWKAFVVEFEGRLIGYCSLVKQFSTWDVDYYMYLDCLFVSEAFRGKRIGASLMKKAQEYALENDCVTMQWQTPDFNKDAIRFYKRLGAESKIKERFILAFFRC